MSNETTLDDLLALVAKAEHGKWLMYGGTNRARVQTDDVIVCDGSSPNFMQPEDARAIAAAVNYLRAHGDELRAALEDARRYRWIAAEAKRYKGDDSPKMLSVSITVPRESDGFLGIRHCPADLNAAIDAAQEVGRE